VPYAPCTCDDKPLASLPNPSGEAYLFNDSVPNDMEFQIVNWKFLTVKQVQHSLLNKYTFDFNEFAAVRNF
jgi:hypothetical protein